MSTLSVPCTLYIVQSVYNVQKSVGDEARLSLRKGDAGQGRVIHRIQGKGDTGDTREGDTRDTIQGIQGKS